MTTEKFLEKNYFGTTLDIAHADVMESDIITAMQEYAEMKCKQLLEIVAEKVTLNEEYYNNIKTVIEKGSNSYEGEQVKIFIDKDSILNCVDIESFCK